MTQIQDADNQSIDDLTDRLLLGSDYETDYVPTDAHPDIMSAIGDIEDGDTLYEVASEHAIPIETLHKMVEHGRRTAETGKAITDTPTYYGYCFYKAYMMHEDKQIQAELQHKSDKRVRDNRRQRTILADEYIRKTIEQWNDEFDNGVNPNPTIGILRIKLMMKLQGFNI